MAGEFHPSTGVTPFKQSPGYASYKSPYGPKYKMQRNINGWTIKQFTRLGMTLGAFGGVAGVFAVFFFAEIPKVRNDIMVNVPFIGKHFIKEIPASDNGLERKYPSEDPRSHQEQEATRSSCLLKVAPEILEAKNIGWLGSTANFMWKNSTLLDCLIMSPQYLDPSNRPIPKLPCGDQTDWTTWSSGLEEK
ncbi:hypothetical protein VTL71DRAFT_1187 [Oculimacula yallundae]|uniref:Uncharacterized protein n=1 Tax=Oculimacula yallundae TaxID=86028 RepID=A0ABR4D2C6_9HELO